LSKFSCFSSEIRTSSHHRKSQNFYSFFFENSLIPAEISSKPEHLCPFPHGSRVDGKHWPIPEFIDDLDFASARQQRKAEIKAWKEARKAPGQQIGRTQQHE
jgi:hypothetical protein